MWGDETNAVEPRERKHRRREAPLVGGVHPQENLDILAPKSVDSEGIFMPSICFLCQICRVPVLLHKCWIAGIVPITYWEGGPGGITYWEGGPGGPPPENCQNVSAK